MELLVFLCLFWCFQHNTVTSIRHSDYNDFTETICEGQCKILECPQNTVMMIQMMKVIYGYMKDKKCHNNNSMSSIESEGNLESNCNQMLQKELGEKTNSECSNKSNCLICHRKGSAAKYERCKEITATTIMYICISDNGIEEVVPENTYVDLTCGHLIGQRIVIHKATIFPNIEQTRTDKDPEKKANCQIIDVTSFVSIECSKKYKCQAGPNSLIPSGCSSRKLLINYSCVPETILKIDIEPINTGLQEKKVVQIKTREVLTGKDATSYQDINNKDTAVVDNSGFHAWILGIVSILIVIALAAIAMIYRYISRKRLSSNNLSTKIKLLNFVPPPSSIEKIEIDLRPNHDSSLLCTDSNCDLQCGNVDVGYWKNTLYQYPYDAPNYSLSAGSSGQMSNYQSDASK